MKKLCGFVVLAIFIFYGLGALATHKIAEEIALSHEISKKEAECLTNKVTDKYGGNIKFGFDIVMYLFGYRDEDIKLENMNFHEIRRECSIDSKP